MRYFSGIKVAKNNTLRAKKHVVPLLRVGVKGETHFGIYNISLDIVA